MGISITQSGSDIRCLQYSIVESFSRFCTEATLFVVGELSEEPVSIDGNQFVVVSCRNVDRTNNVYTLWPKSFFDLLQVQFPWVNKELTFDALCSQMGIQTMMQFSSNTTYWCLPYTKLRSFLDTTYDQIDISGGGGVLFTFVTNGKLFVSDLTKADSQSATGISGNLSGVQTTRDWMINVQGFQHMERYNIKGFESFDIDMHKDSGKAGYRSIIFNEKSKTRDETIIRNVYNRKLYTQQVRTYSSVFTDKMHLGLKVKDADGYESIVYQIKVSSNNTASDVEVKTVYKW